MTDTARRMVRREFPKGGHGYYLDGKRIPGVTTIIGQSSPSGGLLKWYGTEAAQWAAAHWELREELGHDKWVEIAALAAETTRDRAADRGRAIHEAADALVAGEPIDVPEEIAAPASNVIRFLDAWGANVQATECVVFHTGYRYAGQFDAIAELSDGQRWLLDYKTGSGVYSTVALQLAAYRNAEYLIWDGREIAMPRIDATGVVHITENGFELIPVDTGPEVFETFVNSIPVYRFHGTKIGRDAIGTPLPDPTPIATVTHIVRPEVTS